MNAVAIVVVVVVVLGFLAGVVMSSVKLARRAERMERPRRED